MICLDNGTLEKIYAGWLGKLIGIRSGAPIEMWTDKEIFDKYGEIDGYPIDYKNFAADDDSNGNIFALETFFDYDLKQLSCKDFGKNILNYAPFEHGYFWWGGYGISQEHTSYLNMQNGLMPPYSGSKIFNGAMLSEQIGGQIFSDVYGLICPGDYFKAADIAEKAARVTHDGEAVNGGRFIAACISAAFIKKSVDEVICAGLEVLPKNSEYGKIFKEIIDFYNHSDKQDFRACLKYIQQNYWKDKYGGNCHIIPNAAIIALSLKYGGSDFDKTINICNMCGFDTDCNTSNIATILGVLLGLKGIDYDKWRKPINDLTICSGVLGSKNIIDVPSFVYKLARAAEKVCGKSWQGDYVKAIYENKCFGFDLPDSTHGFISGDTAVKLRNSRLNARSGLGSLEIESQLPTARVYKKTYFNAEEMYDNRYDPAFSPLVYCGQTLSCFIKGDSISARLYVRDNNSEKYIEGEKVKCGKDWQKLEFAIPKDTEGANLCEMGISIEGVGTVFIDDFKIEGTARYVLDFSKEHAEYYTLQHQEVSQCTFLKGYWRLDGGKLCGSCADYGELYSGHYDFRDIDLCAEFIPIYGENHYILFNVQGGQRCYAAGFEKGKLVLNKKDGEYRNLVSIDFDWRPETVYKLRVSVKGGNIEVSIDDKKMMAYVDDKPYLRGQFGAAVRKCSHTKYIKFYINSNKE